jgi:exopolysaccharide production protein ExoY
MATQLHDMAAPLSATSALIAQPSAPGAATRDPAADGNARLFGLVREEPLVQDMAAPVLASTDPSTAALQRAVDIALASICIVLLAPIMLAAAMLVLLSGPGAVFYSHPRFGRDGRIFGCLKFRTMRRDADQLLEELLASSPAINEQWQKERKLLHDPRTTAIGRFLRKYSVDELPQLFNVLKGDMSIVGPRPLPTDQAHYYGQYFSVYCSMKPGITGLWQVSGRNDVYYFRRVELDCVYARTRTLVGDLSIIVRTVPVVLRGTGY